ncbi:MAG: hypothetical protein QM638_02115 [Nocardioides sp.]|uniref:hypothetical protein n=1 Tax=Nocardioides sp. TaxID=35761 RepID=UPI0039E417A0
MGTVAEAIRPHRREAEIEQLRARMRRLERASTGRELTTHPVLADLLRLRTGSAYAVGDVGLALLLLAGPSAAGEWCAVIGEPDLGVLAAAETGVNLERTILVPQPGECWVEATAALIDVATLVVLRPPGRVPVGLAERLAARLRARDAALVCLGRDWPRAEARVTLGDPRWVGPGQGEGHLRARRVEVEVRRGTAPARRTTLWFPSVEGRIMRAESEASGAVGPGLREVG